MTTHRLNAAFTATALLAMPLTMAADVAPAFAATSKKVYGTSVSMHWGTVRVALTVKGKKITAVQAAYPTERPRSARINAGAIPALRAEVLRAQSAKIHAISGATDTSEAYISSLATAVRKAGI